MLVLSSIITSPRLTKSFKYELKSFEKAYRGPIVGNFKVSVQKSNIFFTCSGVKPCKLSAFPFSAIIFPTTCRIRRLAIIVSWYIIYTNGIDLYEFCILYLPINIDVSNGKPDTMERAYLVHGAHREIYKEMI